MITQNIQALVEDALNGVNALLPAEGKQVRDVVEKAVKTQLEKKLGDMNLVSKEEFRAHNQLLSRLKERVLILEEKVEQLEAKQR